MNAHPTTDDKLRAAVQRRDAAQAILSRCLREIGDDSASEQRRDDALSLLCQVMEDIDRISMEIDELLELRAIERDPDRMT